MEVSKQILDNIADSLEAGFKGFIHRDTFEVVTYLDPGRYFDLDPVTYKEEMDKIKKNKKKFIEIEEMDSRESFRVMEEFAESLETSTTKIKLITALEGHKPFANFKHQIENSGDFRQLWFAFRREKNIEWIKNHLTAVSR